MKRVERHQASHVLDRRDPPVVEVEPGETILVETEDALNATYRSAADLTPERLAEGVRGGYPVSGPIFLRGAQPGDTLTVRVDGIELDEQGVTLFRAGGGALLDWFQVPRGKILPVSDGLVHFSEAIRVPVRPMIGKIGTAPALEALRSSAPGPHGGNMDCPDITVGSTVYLPVEVPGGLLYVGDVHAAMADGEVCGTGVETRACLTLTIGLRRGRPRSMNWPRVETSEAIMVVAAGPLEAAMRLALKDLILWLEEDYGFERADTYLLLSLVGDARICQAVNNLCTVRAIMPKRYLPKGSR